MSNDVKSQATYERLVKLWISVWKLVLDDKRHFETVCAMLQQIVFGTDPLPKYKNWPEICKLGSKDRFMMMAVATLDVGRADEQAQRIIASFPHCFSGDYFRDPVPLSVIRYQAEQKAREHGDETGHPALHPISHDAVPAHIPVQGFDKFGRDVALGSSVADLLRLPGGIDPGTPQGSTVTWEGKQFVVLENNRDCEELYIAPAECVRVDI